MTNFAGKHGLVKRQYTYYQQRAPLLYGYAHQRSAVAHGAVSNRQRPQVDEGKS